MSLRGDAIRLIHRYGPPRLVPNLEHNIKESLRLVTRQVAEEETPLGRTKIGGRPDLPDHVDWPVWRNLPQYFVAQVNLCDLPDFDFLRVLPPEGILSFFYCGQTGGFDPRDKGSWRVFHFEDRNLRRREYPEDLLDDEELRNCPVEFRYSITIPELESPYTDLRYGESDQEEIEQYSDLRERLAAFLGEADPIHRLLGHPEQQQNDMQTECQLVSHGLYCGDASGYTDPRAETLKPGAKDWELLLQVDSDDSAGMMWGDAGRLYFWIPRHELRNRNFEATWMIQQGG